jgi:nicotinate dehydrogenase subunit B
VVAPKEWDAVRAAAQLKVSWETPPALPGSDKLFDYMRSAESKDVTVRQTGDVSAPLPEGGKRVTLEHWAPYQSHAPFAPNCAVASVRADGAEVVCPSQDIYALRRTLALLLGLTESSIKVTYADSAGTYGHSCYDDVAEAAAILSQLAGAPVRVQLMRWDEHGWDTYGGPHGGKATVAAAADGKLLSYEYECWQHNWSFVDASVQLATGAPAAEWPRGAPQGVNPVVCGGMYKIPNVKLTDHQISSLPLLRSAWLRSPLDLALTFTSEQAIDQLAFELGIDQYQFRLQNIADERWRGVLDAVAKASNWLPQRTAWTQQQRAAAAAALKSTIGRSANTSTIAALQSDIVSGRGIGLGTHLAGWGAAVAAVEVNQKTGVVRVDRLFGAIDAGLAVNPAIVEAQIEGQLVQTVGRMLYEEVTFDERGVTSLDWSTYKVARFSDAPQITPIVVQRVDQPSSGAGEEAMAAGAAAIANAFFDATGKRMTTFPFTPERVLKALA